MPSKRKSPPAEAVESDVESATSSSAPAAPTAAALDPVEAARLEAERALSRDLKRSLLGHNAAFEHLLGLIPRHFYLHPEELERLAGSPKPPVRFDKDGKALPPPKINKKAAAVQAKRDEQMAKKLNNERKRLRLEEKEIALKAQAEGITLPTEDDKPAPSITELRERLAKRVAEVQHPVAGARFDANAATRQALIAQRSAVREQKRALEQAQRAKERKAAKKQAAARASASASVEPSFAPVVAATGSVPPPLDDRAAEPDFAFSSLDFASSSAVRAVDKGRAPEHKRGRASVTSSDPALALKALEDRKAFLEKLGPDARARAEDNDRWKHAELRAEGARVLDDETKLARSIRKKDKDKAKKTAAWNDRIKETDDAQAAKQAKRTANIQARKDAKSTGKVKKARPGFEGAPAAGKRTKSSMSGGKRK